jgi:hypothetical protein
VQYRIQFHDAAVISELIADARSVNNTIALVAEVDWPPQAVALRVLDADGREVHSEIRSDEKGRRADDQGGSTALRPVRA